VIEYGFDALHNRVVKSSEKNGQLNKTAYIRDANGNIVAVYEYSNNQWRWTEQHLYGAERLGVHYTGEDWDAAISNEDLTPSPATGTTSSGLFYLINTTAFGLSQPAFKGRKNYELTNHLGNVMAVVSDKLTKYGFVQTGTLPYAMPNMVSATDYDPFGMALEQRDWQHGGVEEYGFSFNTQLESPEIGDGHTTAMYWEYDARIGRRWELDPVFIASICRYAVNGNSPIVYFDPKGDFRTKAGALAYKLACGGDEIRRDTKSGQYFVGKEVSYNAPGVGVMYERRFDWNGSRKPYTGSGWLHQERAIAARVLGVSKNSNGLMNIGFNSLLHTEAVTLTGDMLNLVADDLAIIALEKNLLERVKSDKRFGSESFMFDEKTFVQFGGKRGSLNPFRKSSINTWKVGANKLTWVVRSVDVYSEVAVSQTGQITIFHHFEDNLDLRPEKGGKIYFGEGDRPRAYNIVSSLAGVPYHDILGANDKMKIRAAWGGEY
jgi:hypothetical protein